MRAEEVDVSRSCPLPSSLLTPEERMRSRYDNFYNGYNTSSRRKEVSKQFPKDPQRCGGQVVDGKRPTCENVMPKKSSKEETKKPSCSIDVPIALPPSIKPCDIKLVPPDPCNPDGTWTVKVYPCALNMGGTRKENDMKNTNDSCKVGCKHWTSKEPPCLYDDPCPAHCYNHPPGIKPSGRFP